MTNMQDPMGAAIEEYYRTGKAAKLRVFSPDFDEDEIPLPTLFRTYSSMPPLERKALDLAKGRILDVGAGSGCHSLALQAKGQTVEAVEISPLCAEMMRKRGVKKVLEQDFFQLQGGPYDTILMLMNGSGIIGTVERMPEFFGVLNRLLAPGGQVLLDSSDLRYLYEEEDGSFAIDLAGDYYGQMYFQMQYRNIKGPEFPWLYIDFMTLQMYAETYGYEAELVMQGSDYDYLARLKRK